MYLPPLIIIPLLLAPPIPAKNASGTEITIAHGQEATKQTNALYSHTENVPPNIVGITATRIAITTTIGVYTLANLVINFSESPLFC